MLHAAQGGNAFQRFRLRRFLRTLADALELRVIRAGDARIRLPGHAAAVRGDRARPDAVGCLQPIAERPSVGRTRRAAVRAVRRRQRGKDRVGCGIIRLRQLPRLRLLARRCRSGGAQREQHGHGCQQSQKPFPSIQHAISSCEFWLVSPNSRPHPIDACSVRRGGGLASVLPQVLVSQC